MGVEQFSDTVSDGLNDLKLRSLLDDRAHFADRAERYLEKLPRLSARQASAGNPLTRLLFKVRVDSVRSAYENEAKLIAETDAFIREAGGDPFDDLDRESRDLVASDGAGGDSKLY